MPRKDLTCLAVLGWGKVSIAFVFSGLTLIPPLEIKCPRYSTSLVAKRHLEGCRVRFAALRLENTNSKCSRC